MRVPYGPSRGRRWADLDDAALARIIETESGGNVDMRFSARNEQARRRGAPPKPAQMSLGLAETPAA